MYYQGKIKKGWNGYTWSYNCVYYQGKIRKVGMDIHDLITELTIQVGTEKKMWNYVIISRNIRKGWDGEKEIKDQEKFGEKQDC